MNINDDKPKFKLGDVVVNKLLSTVGSVTKIINKNGSFYYEINNSGEHYPEAALQNLEDYNRNIYELEQLELKYKFYFGDLVIVEGYGSDIFKIIGIHTDIWRYKDGAWEEVTYELTRITDGEWMEAGEEQLRLLADAGNSDTFLQKMTLLYSVQKDLTSLELYEIMDVFRKSEREQLRIKKQKKEIIDGLLDVYNDYKHLYESFNDEYYKEVMEVAIANLKKLTQQDKSQ